MVAGWACCAAAVAANPQTANTVQIAVRIAASPYSLMLALLTQLLARFDRDLAHVEPEIAARSAIRRSAKSHVASTAINYLLADRFGDDRCRRP
jgi:hypothetical protein